MNYRSPHASHPNYQQLPPLLSWRVELGTLHYTTIEAKLRQLRAGQLPQPPATSFPAKVGEQPSAIMQ